MGKEWERTPGADAVEWGCCWRRKGREEREVCVRVCVCVGEGGRLSFFFFISAGSNIMSGGWVQGGERQRTLVKSVWCSLSIPDTHLQKTHLHMHTRTHTHIFRHTETTAMLLWSDSSKNIQSPAWRKYHIATNPAVLPFVRTGGMMPPVGVAFSVTFCLKHTWDCKWWSVLS